MAKRANQQGACWQPGCCLAVALVIISVVCWQWLSTSKRQDDILREQERRGALVFMRVCSGCHALDLVRWRQMADDLHLSPVQRSELMSGQTVDLNAPWSSAMSAESAQQWYGVAPPDLSLAAQIYSTGWISGYLNAFYPDPARPSGWNNRLMPETAMPDVLWDFPLQSAMQDTKHPSARLTRERAIAQITTFLAYTADPMAHRRRMLGPWVIGFFCLFTIVVWLLQREYWRDIL